MLFENYRLNKELKKLKAFLNSQLRYTNYDLKALKNEATDNEVSTFQSLFNEKTIELYDQLLRSYVFTNSKVFSKVKYEISFRNKRLVFVNFIFIASHRIKGSISHTIELKVEFKIGSGIYYRLTNL